MMCTNLKAAPVSLVLLFQDQDHLENKMKRLICFLFFNLSMSIVFFLRIVLIDFCFQLMELDNK